MVPEAQNRAVARLCGWEDVPPFQEDPSSLWPDREIHKMIQPFMIDPKGSLGKVPNYYGDLNLIHAAINARDEQIRAVPDFYETLERIIGRDKGIDLFDPNRRGFSGLLAHATAPQLTETFLIFFERWEEND